MNESRELILCICSFGMLFIGSVLHQGIMLTACDIAEDLGEPPPKKWKWVNIYLFQFWHHMKELVRQHGQPRLQLLYRLHIILLWIQLSALVLFLIFGYHLINGL